MLRNAKTLAIISAMCYNIQEEPDTGSLTGYLPSPAFRENVQSNRGIIMIEKKNDRRTVKTRRAICDAFAELLTEKKLHKITVQEIADKADINRVTFYKHYLDVYDLYDKVEEELLIELGLLMLALNEADADSFYSCLIEYIHTHQIVFRMMFSPNGTNSLREKFSQMMEGIFLTLLSEQQERDPADRSISYFSCYRTQGCIAIIEKWVRNGLAEPKEFVIRMLTDLDRNTEKLIGNV